MQCVVFDNGYLKANLEKTVMEIDALLATMKTITPPEVLPQDTPLIGAYRAIWYRIAMVACLSLLPYPATDSGTEILCWYVSRGLIIPSKFLTSKKERKGGSFEL